jgi:hypothetical protein
MTQRGGSLNNPTQAKRRLEWATHFLGGRELGHLSLNLPQASYLLLGMTKGRVDDRFSAAPTGARQGRAHVALLQRVEGNECG